MLLAQDLVGDINFVHIKMEGACAVNMLKKKIITNHNTFYNKQNVSLTLTLFSETFSSLISSLVFSFSNFFLPAFV